MRTTNIGGGNADYVMLTDTARATRARALERSLALSAVPHGAGGARAWPVAIDGPFGDYSRSRRFPRAGRRAPRSWAAKANGRSTRARWRSPTRSTRRQQKKSKRAEAILAAMKEAQEKGLGAVALNGVLIDAASIRQAEGIVKQMQMIRSRTA